MKKFKLILWLLCGFAAIFLIFGASNLENDDDGDFLDWFLPILKIIKDKQSAEFQIMNGVKYKNFEKIQDNSTQGLFWYPQNEPDEGEQVILFDPEKPTMI